MGASDEFTWHDEEPDDATQKRSRATAPGGRAGATAEHTAYNVPPAAPVAAPVPVEEPDSDKTRLAPRRFERGQAPAHPTYPPPATQPVQPHPQPVLSELQPTSPTYVEPVQYPTQHPGQHPAQYPVPPAAPSPEVSEALTPDRLLHGRRTAPESGMRRFVYNLTGGSVNLGDPPAVVYRKQLEARVQAALTGPTRYVVVLSRKGGVGKTTTTTTLGMTMASLRHDRICAIDGNPDRGTLVDLVERGTDKTVFDVAAGAASVANFSDMSRLVSRDVTRLDVVASDADPAHARAFGAADYELSANLLSRFYSVVLTDTGLDFTHEIQRAILARADAIVVVAGGSYVEARLAAETLDVITGMGFGHLASKAVVAIQSASETPVNVAEIARHFATRVAAVVQIPRDQHLAEGSRIDLNRLAPATRLAALELAAHVVDTLTTH